MTTSQQALIFSSIVSQLLRTSIRPFNLDWRIILQYWLHSSIFDGNFESSKNFSQQVLTVGIDFKILQFGLDDKK